MIDHKIALIGNPNVGKSTLFNTLTGLKQTTGNYPGITVEKKVGRFKALKTNFLVYDLPGIYNIYPTSADEEIVTSILQDPKNENHPDYALVVSDLTNLKRGVLLYQQIRSLGVPACFVLNYEGKNRLEITELENYLQSKVLVLNAKKTSDLNDLKTHLENIPKQKFNDDFEIPLKHNKIVQDLDEKLNLNNHYKTWHLLANQGSKNLTESQNQFIQETIESNKLVPKRLQTNESIVRNQNIDSQLNDLLKKIESQNSITNRLDKVLMHPFWGYLIFFGFIFLIFQAIYSWAAYPQDFVEGIIIDFGNWVSKVLPPGPINDIINEGIIAGFAGIFVFVPQIAILFFFISLMEGSGYMSRVVYLMDRWMKPFGLNGKSVVPFISGVACAIPAIMSARNIENQKERLITILVTPFMTCSARLPIYTLIIALVIPDVKFWIFNLKGIVLLSLYLLGLFAALASAWILKKILKSNYKSYLILEIPKYRIPHWRDVLNNMFEKTWSFVWGAGRIILAVSIILWVLGSYGVGDKFNNAEEFVQNKISTNGFNPTQKELANDYYLNELAENPNLNQSQKNDLKLEIENLIIENEIAAQKLQHSFLGNLGSFIEPVVKPLGMDWKMGIGVLSSFAAREVFVSTMGTVYSLGNTDEEATIEKRMHAEINPITGKSVYNWKNGIALLIFYAFAMQCMSTLAVVKQETNSWKWPLIQLVFMSILAYVGAVIFYQTFNV